MCSRMRYLCQISDDSTSLLWLIMPKVRLAAGGSDRRKADKEPRGLHSLVSHTPARVSGTRLRALQGHEWLRWCW